MPYYAREVNIVASNPANLIIRLDGEIIPSEHAGSDVIDGIVEVNDARLYNIIDSPVAGVHSHCSAHILKPKNISFLL